MRAQLQPQLQAPEWWGSITQHSELGCERFADQIAWAYWQSPDNVMKPSGVAGEGGQLTPAAFRAALASALGVQPIRTLAALKGTKAHRKG
jgi:hypothetical protein